MGLEHLGERLGIVELGIMELGIMGEKFNKDMKMSIDILMECFETAPIFVINIYYKILK